MDDSKIDAITGGSIDKRINLCEGVVRLLQYLVGIFQRVGVMGG
jgi:hypothetical protein